MNDQFGSGVATTAASSGSFWVVAGWVLLLAAIAVMTFLIWLKRKRLLLRLRRQVDMRALRVMLPRESAELPEGKKDPKEVIAVMEPVYAALSHFYEKKSSSRFWNGQPTFSFEIVAHGGEVYFYVLAPVDHVDALERQIHAQYPSAHIEQTDDYDLFLSETGESAVAGLTLNRSFIFPVRTYRSMDTDPLNALTNTLSKIQDGTAAFQVVLEPIEQKWQHRTAHALQNVQQGRDFHSGDTLGKKTAKVLQEIGKTVTSKPAESEEHNEAYNTAKGNVRLTAMQEQQAKQMVEKSGKLGFNVQVRVVARAATAERARAQVQTMLSAFSQYQAPDLNGFRAVARDNRRLLLDYLFRTFSRYQKTMILNTEELTSLFHFPNIKLETPNIHWLGARRLSPPVNLPKSGLLLGYSLFRGQEVPVYLGQSDRMRHVYAIGQTGVGKTNLYQSMILQDIRNGEGVCYMDPNGDAAEWILRHIPKERAEDVIFFNPADVDRPMGLNLLEYDPAVPDQKAQVINELISIFDKLYDLRQTGGPMFEQYMRNAALLIMDDPSTGSTLLEIPRVLADAEFRKQKLLRCQDLSVVHFWQNEAEKAGGEAALANIVPYITSKLSQFTSSEIMRAIIGQQESAFNFRKIMDERKILIVSLPKGLLGETSAALLGMIISGKIQIAAFSRQNQPESERVPFYLYVDEFQNFTSKTFATILSEARKYALSLNVTHQYIDQLDEETRNAVFGNVGTIISWRIGAKDAEFMQKIMEPLKEADLIGVEKFNYYVRLLVDSAPTKPFNVTTYPPDPHENVKVAEAVRQLSRLKYGRDRAEIDASIRLRSKSAILAP